MARLDSMQPICMRFNVTINVPIRIDPDHPEKAAEAAIAMARTRLMQAFENLAEHVSDFEVE